MSSYDVIVIGSDAGGGTLVAASNDELKRRLYHQLTGMLADLGMHFFPSIGAVNPALTAMANGLRVGDHLPERMGARWPEAHHAVT
jgi:choline dehydrogenase-like flavoprotein